jgi:3-keto-disaccharide hydrolase
LFSLNPSTSTTTTEGPRSWATPTISSHSSNRGNGNQVEIIADGHTLIHIVNGHVMSTLVDTDPKYYQAKGLIAFEIEGPGNLQISHRNVRLKKLP